MAQTRQLAVIMFSDIVGYTRMMGQDINKTLNLIKKSKEIQKPLVIQHNGEWLKEMGDGAMMKFNTAIDAVNCAIDIQRAAQVDLPAYIRIGIHLGDIVIDDGEIYGDGINVASRIEAIADPGGIYISESVEKAIRGQGVQTKIVGKINLKNVSYKVKIFAVQGEGLPQSNKIASKIKLITKTTIALLGLLLLVPASFLSPKQKVLKKRDPSPFYL